MYMCYKLHDTFSTYTHTFMCPCPRKGENEGKRNNKIITCMISALHVFFFGMSFTFFW
jgi:hypothetical protein